MASKKSLLGKVFAFSLFAAFSMSANAQIKYNSSGRLTIGTTTPSIQLPIMVASISKITLRISSK